MKHLDPADVVDLMDGRAPEPAARHAESCPACRLLVDDARRAVELASTDEVPEPSPLFWTAFSSQVGASIGRVPDPVRSWTGLSLGWRAVPVGSVIVLAVLVGLAQWQSRHQMPSPAAVRVAVPVAEQMDTATVLPADDEPWALVSQLIEAAADSGMSAGDLPATIGSGDRALESLSEGEKVEIVRLLKAEMDEPGVSPN